ncbi:MAG: hypothetical protein R8M70_04445 [Alphaproteobacteria bacterium]|nr:hypothetical protein [Alphaproteobacteria bacterium]
MKKFVFLGFALFLAACGNKYQETGLLCEDAEHNSAQAQITLDVNADNKVANIVVNGESVTLTAAPEKESTHIMYYGKNTNDETVKLIIGFSKDGKTADSYMLGINSGETVYGCYKK